MTIKRLEADSNQYELLQQQRQQAVIAQNMSNETEATDNLSRLDAEIANQLRYIKLGFELLNALLLEYSKSGIKIEFCFIGIPNRAR